MKNDILEAIKYLDINIEDCNDSHELYEAIDYNGTMHELIDGMIDIYYYDLRKWCLDNHNYDLRKWCLDNHNYIGQAIEEGLCDDLDFHKQIAAGQYVYYSELARETVEEVYTELTEKVAV